MEQLVLVVRSVLGPGGASACILHTEGQDLIEIMLEYSDLRMRLSGQEEARDKITEEVEEIADQGAIKEDGFWHCIPEPTFSFRLAGTEEKWYAVGLGEKRDVRGSCIVITTVPEIDFDVISIEKTRDPKEAIELSTKRLDQCLKDIGITYKETDVFVVVPINTSFYYSCKAPELGFQ